MADPVKPPLPHVTGNLAADVAADAADLKATAPALSAVTATITQPEVSLYNLIQKLGQKFLADLKSAQSYANAKDANGNLADPLACPCLAALIPVAELVINGPLVAQGATPPASGDAGIVTELSKVRIIRLAIQSQALKTACAPLVQDEVQNIQSFSAGLLSLLQGATLAGIVPAATLAVL